MKSNFKQLHRKDFLLPALTFLLVGGLLCALFTLMEYHSIQEERARCRYIAANQASLLGNGVNAALSRAYSMKALLVASNGDTAFFDAQAQDIYEEANQQAGMTLKNIAVAPGGTVEKVYPLTGNESLVGFSFMDASQPGNAEAIEAYQRGELVVTAPFNLVQGGMGMAGRLPVFLDDGSGRQFWGLVTVTMDFDRLLNAFRLSALTDMGLNYELWYTGTDGERVSLAASAASPADPVTYQFSLANQVWNIDVAPQDGWVDYTGMLLKFAVALAIGLMLGLLQLDKAKLNRINTRLEQLATLDSLTLCYSRHYVNTVLLNQRTGSWNDPRSKYSLAIVDIDCFKGINDTYGHEIGDRAIVAVAQVLIDSTKQANGDCVIRFGGDEFIVLYNDVTEKRFTDKLAEIVQGVRAIRFADQPQLRLSVSVGGEHFASTEQSRYYEMLERADKKLYEAKETGRDRFCM